MLREQLSPKTLYRYFVQIIDLDRIVPGKYQPRQAFPIESQLDLTASIKATGVQQALVVRPIEDGKFELISGERRWRSLRDAGFQSTECLVRSATDLEAAVSSLSANLFEPINAIDEAGAFAVLESEFNLSHADIAQIAGKRDNRAYVSKALRLLKLPREAQALIAEGALTPSHGQVLLMLPPDRESEIGTLAKKAVRGKWSVEKLRQAIRTSDSPSTSRAEQPFADLEKAISQQIGLPFSIRRLDDSGAFRVTVTGESPEQLQMLLTRLKK